MIFSSYIFIFLFLPVSLVGFYLLGKIGQTRFAFVWLVGVSIIFYGWWNPIYTWLLMGSIIFNYSVGSVLAADQSILPRKLIAIFCIGVNLGFLGYFKYTNFIITNFNTLAATNVHVDSIVLPLAISFFTFTQIAYIVDALRKEVRERNFISYCLFVTFFPHLIAGPIIHHREIMPQFSKRGVFRPNYENLAVGIVIFTIGLFKKVFVADDIAKYAGPVFDAAEAGQLLTLTDAWIGAISYTLQLYFDFSGYSDMAIGSARMFGIRFPINFDSPYKAQNIIEFWRRWHITLSRFLRNYVYIPLGGSRKGEPRRYITLMITMFLGGLWHGAGWTFVLWGLYHGLCLTVNHAWQWAQRAHRQVLDRQSFMGGISAHIITFTAVVIGWVLFRAESIEGASTILFAMFGANHLVQEMTDATMVRQVVQISTLGMLKFPVLLFVVWFLPNTQQIMRRFKPGIETYHESAQAGRLAWLEWKPSSLCLVITIIAAVLSVANLGNNSEFLYFNF